MKNQLASKIAGNLILLGAAANSFAANEKVEQLFEQNCSSCHGQSLKGAMAPSLLDNQWLTDGTDLALQNAISNGVAETAMPAFGKTFTPDQIRTLVVYIRESAYKATQSQDDQNTFDKPFKTKDYELELTEVTSNEGIIWAMDFLPDGSLLYTLRHGELWHLLPSGEQSLVKGTPTVWHQRQGGLLDVYPDPNFKENGWVYLSFSKPAGKNEKGDEIAFTSIVRGKISNGQWVEQQVLFEAQEQNHKNRGWHFGSRIVIQGEYLYFSNGDEGHQNDAQLITTQNGKIHRIFKDGSIPKDNPFYNDPTAQKTIWTYGNRNPQGLTIDSTTGNIWATEHGPRGGDELNLIQKGLNYGWPKVTFGMNYDGTPITPNTELPGMKSPILHWTPSIAVSGINFYTGELFGSWKGDLLVGSLAKKQLHRLRIENGKVTQDEVLLNGLGRIRDVVTAPSGEIYVTINDSDSKVSKIFAIKPKLNK
ncbi:PQQ-dependent oxidoreductase, gdhB family [Pseudoalteromonas luteoviolacea B = ATCC 29581]|nr:PQQ-dependent oxidoreductase, gdhB family [Pseudoalteromonas luteoviolacea B = ATCC 29581]